MSDRRPIRISRVSSGSSTARSCVGPDVSPADACRPATAAGAGAAASAATLTRNPTPGLPGRGRARPSSRAALRPGTAAARRLPRARRDSPSSACAAQEPRLCKPRSQRQRVVGAPQRAPRVAALKRHVRDHEPDLRLLGRLHDQAGQRPRCFVEAPLGGRDRRARQPIVDGARDRRQCASSISRAAPSRSPLRFRISAAARWAAGRSGSSNSAASTCSCAATGRPSRASTSASAARASARRGSAAQTFSSSQCASASRPWRTSSSLASKRASRIQDRWPAPRAPRQARRPLPGGAAARSPDSGGLRPGLRSGPAPRESSPLRAARHRGAGPPGRDRSPPRRGAGRTPEPARTRWRPGPARPAPAPRPPPLAAPPRGAAPRAAPWRTRAARPAGLSAAQRRPHGEPSSVGCGAQPRAHWTSTRPPAVSATVIAPSRSVRSVRMPRAAYRATTSGAGKWNWLRHPSDITARRGPTASSSSSLDDVRLPW